MKWQDLESFSFGDSPNLADELAALVLAGLKTATCWAVTDGMLTTVGKRMVMLDGAHVALAVLETTELVQRRFNEVDAAFAYDEGEGDRSLAYWRQAHRQYFGRRGQFAEDMLLYCERFRIVERIADRRRGACLDSLRGGLIVSCQPVAGGPLDAPAFVAALAQAAVAGGAAGLRIEGLANLRAVRAATDRPIIGLIKRTMPETEVFITPLPEDVIALSQAGADIVAFDATQRPRPAEVAALAAAAHAGGALAMADLAVAGDAKPAVAAGVDIVSSTLSGYTGGAVPEEPDLALVAALARFNRAVFAEGRYRTPAQAQAAMSAGAFAVVVGSAITRVEHITGWFAAAVRASATNPP